MEAKKDKQKHKQLAKLTLGRVSFHLLAVFVLVLAVYVCTMPRQVVLEDDGLFIMSSYHSGVSHPPGYPLHSLLGKLFTLIPVSTIAFRVHLLSAFFGAAACCVIWWIVFSITGRRIGAYTAALAYGFCEAFWSQAIIAEIYTLNAFLFFLLLALSVQYVRRPKPRLLIVIAFLYGLSLANHWPLIVLSTPCLIFILWPERRAILKNLPRMVPCLILGLLPYVWMVVRSQMDPQISFYGPIETLKDFWFFVARKGYAHVDVSTSSAWWDKVQFTGFLGRQCFLQFVVFGAIFAGVGIYYQFRHSSRRETVGFLAGFLASGFALILLLGFDYESLNLAVFRPYPLVPYGIEAIWLGLGLGWIAERGGRRFGTRAVILTTAAGVILVLGILASNWKVNNRRDDTWAYDYAETILSTLEKDAILFTHSDINVGTVGYLSRVEGMRSDVDVYNDQGLVFSNRLFHPTKTSRAGKKEALLNFVQSTDRPIYYIDKFSHSFGKEDFGLYKKLLKHEDASVLKFTVKQAIQEYFRRAALQKEHTDRWILHHRDTLMATFGEYFAQIVYLSGAQNAKDKYGAYLDLAASNYLGKLSIISVLVQHGPKSQYETLWKWLDEAEIIMGENPLKKQSSRLYYLKGYLAAGSGGIEEAINYFKQSIAIYPHPENSAVLNLLQIYAARDMKDEYHMLRARIYRDGRVPPIIKELDRKMR